MRLFLLGSILLCATAATAQPATEVAKGAAMTPVEDVNLKKREIPAVLIAAAADPYRAEETGDCARIATAITALNDVLGQDFDSETERKTGLTADRVARGVVASFIPFRGVIREVSGAASAERRYNDAVDAGLARRGYLRGVARVRGCKPAAARAASR